MKHSALTRPELLVVVAVVGCVASAKIIPWLAEQDRWAAYQRATQCQENLKVIGIGLMMYQQDYDNHFPPARSGTTTGWVNALSHYGVGSAITYPTKKRINFLDCPEGKDSPGTTTDYFFNSRLSGIALSRIKSPNQVIVFGDGIDNSPPNTALSSLPSAWLNDPSSPALRHVINNRRHANYCFADGHVQSLAPNRIQSSTKGNQYEPTFALR